MPIHIITSLISLSNDFFELTFSLTSQKLLWNSRSISAGIDRGRVGPSATAHTVACIMSRSEKLSDESLNVNCACCNRTYTLSCRRVWLLLGRIAGIARSAAYCYTRCTYCGMYFGKLLHSEHGICLLTASATSSLRRENSLTKWMKITSSLHWTQQIVGLGYSILFRRFVNCNYGSGELCSETAIRSWLRQDVHKWATC